MSSPSLDDYPGYFPAAKRPFWTRAKVGVVAGLVGLAVGISSSGDAGTDKPEAGSPDSASQSEIDAAVNAATDDLEQQLIDQQDEADASLEAQRKEATAAKAAAVAKAREQAKTKQKTAVKLAVKDALTAERARQPAPRAPKSPPAQTFANTGSTDPRFNWCYEANDAGYGPYQSGVDPEYDWYRDNDGDGIVCES